MRLWIFAACATMVGLVVPVSGAQAFNAMDDNDEIVVVNSCILPMRVLVHFKDKRTGDWITSGWYDMSSGERSTLYRDDQPILSGSDVIFFYADIPEYRREIRGHDARYSEVVDGRKRMFFKVQYEREGFLGPVVGGVFTRLLGLDEYEMVFRCDDVEHEIRDRAMVRHGDECPVAELSDLLMSDNRGFLESGSPWEEKAQERAREARQCEQWLRHEETIAWRRENRVR